MGPQAVEIVLANELYVGEYEVAGVEDHVEGYRIIEDELFERATETRHRFKKGGAREVRCPRTGGG